jgi:dihydroorotate dehydrogenase (NAD+) catalytic subunit
MPELAPNNPYGLALRSPVLVASGALGYGVEYARLLDLSTLGAIVTRTTSLHPRHGVAAPRLIETPAGLLYCGGDVNPGLRHVRARCAPTWATWSVPVIVSVGGATAEQCAEVAAQLEGVEGVAGVELNLARFADRVGTAVALVRAATPLPLIVKLPPDATTIVRAAHDALAAGADALAVAGPPTGVWRDPHTGERAEGWLCGPALLPQTIRLVELVAAAVSAPIIGGGGIATPDDARQVLAAGATAVSIGAALLANPAIAIAIAAALAP